MWTLTALPMGPNEWDSNPDDGSDSKSEGREPPEHFDPDFDGLDSDGYDPEPPAGFFDDPPVTIDLTEDDDETPRVSYVNQLRSMDEDTLVQVSHRERDNLIQQLALEQQQLQQRNTRDLEMLSIMSKHWFGLIDAVNQMFQGFECKPVPSFLCESFSANALQMCVARTADIIPDYYRTTEDCKKAVKKVVDEFVKLTQENQRATRKLFAAKFKESELDESKKILKCNSQWHCMTASMIVAYRHRVFHFNHHVDKVGDTEQAVKVLKDRIEKLEMENRTIELSNNEFKHRIEKRAIGEFDEAIGGDCFENPSVMFSERQECAARTKAPK